MAPPLTTCSGYHNSALISLNQGYANRKWSQLTCMTQAKSHRASGSADGGVGADHCGPACFRAILFPEDGIDDCGRGVGREAKGSQPSFIHCAGGGRAATMWFIKRLVVDHWDADRAAKEATELGMTNPALKQFAIDYAQTHKR